MTDQNTEQTAAVQEPANPKAKAPKKGRVAKGTRHVATKKAKLGTKATTAKKTPKAAKAERTSRPGTKTEMVLELLKRPEGATLSQIMKSTDWQAHSVRGFISGTLGKKMGLAVTSAKREDGERVYSLNQ